MKIRLWTAAFVIVLFSALLSSCNSKSAASTEGVKLQGAGASFPAPLYNKWFKSYSASHPDVRGGLSVGGQRQRQEERDRPHG